MTGIVVESLNIGLPKNEIFHGVEITTGLCKAPVYGPLLLKKAGFAGDGVADTKHHGGFEKAVCVYSSDHYAYWEDILGIKLPNAAFGENLSISNLREDDVCIGDIFQIGTALVQISQPRQPCKTLALRYGRNDMLKLVIDCGYTGFYLRVLKEGIVERGSCLTLKERNHSHITVSFANYVYHHDKKNCEAIKEVLAVQTLSVSWKQSFLELLNKQMI